MLHGQGKRLILSARVWRIAAQAILLTSAAFAAKVVLPDLRTGNVDGLTGVLYWPADLPAANGEPRPWASADGCEVHLVPHADLDLELRRPCGKWFVPPKADRYNFWLETRARMTPTVSMLVYTPKPFRGGGLAAIVPLAPAGRVAIPSDRVMPENESLRMLSIESKHSWGNRIPDRRVAAREARTPVQMPEGRVVVGRFDRRTNDAIALARPVEIKAGRTSLVWPEPPASSDVLVILAKPPELQLAKPIPARLTLDGRTPDAMLSSFDRIIGIWYGIDSRTASIAFESNAAHWPSQSVRLAPGKVTTIRSKIQPLPKVSVMINVSPGATLPADVALEAGTRRVPARAGLNELASLPAEQLPITLRVGAWSRSDVVDLRSGEDASIAFDLQPIVLTGSVFHGRDRAAARISFWDGGEWHEGIETDERGDYAATLWWPDVHTARVSLVGRNLPPYTEAFLEIRESGRRDFHVPKTDYAVRVRDASTGRGIGGARVTAGNVWSDANGNERQAVQHVVTGEEGVAILPPVQKGELIVDVRAERYASREPLRVSVDEEQHELTIDLQPLHIAATVRVLLADRTAAERAEVWAFDDAMRPVWRGAANGEGVLEVPHEAAQALLLIRHPRAASTIRRFPNAETIQLDAPAEPLRVVVEKTTAEKTKAEKPNAGTVALWLDGVKLTGPPLTFATWSTPAVNRSGVWTARNLPPKALQIAIGDELPREVAYPWPSPKF